MDWDGIIVEMACLYTSWDCPSRRRRMQKLSNHVMTPCSLTPLIKNTVTGIFVLRTWFKNASYRFWRSEAIIFTFFLFLRLSHAILIKHEIAMLTLQFNHISQAGSILILNATTPLAITLPKPPGFQIAPKSSQSIKGLWSNRPQTLDQCCQEPTGRWGGP